MALENIPESSELRTEGLAEQIQSEFQAGSELAAQDVERERLSSMELDYSTAENPFGDLAGFNIDFFQNDPKNTQNSVTNQGGGPGDPVPKPRPTRTLAELRKDYQELMQSSKEWGKTFGFEKVKRDPMLAAGDYTFDQYTTNVDRYRGYGKSTFNKLGFNPLDDNETYYNVNTTGWQDFKRMTSQWGKLFGTAFMSNYNSIAHSLTSESLLDPDIEAANKYERAMRLGLSTKNSALGKFTNFSLNSAYTLGIVANVAAEEFIIAGLTAAAAPLTGGGSLVVGAAATATTVKRAARAIDKINDIRRIAAMNIRNTSLLGGGSTMIGGGMQFVRNLKNINNAREFWTGARTAGLTFAKGLGKFVNPLTGTTTFIRGVTEGTNAYKGLSNYAKLTKGFGAFYRDVRENLYSLGESQLEGGTVYNNVFDEALEYYKQKHDGQMPDERGWASIYETAETAGKLDTIINLPVIFLTNRLVFDGLFRFKGLSNAMDAAEEAAMRNTAKGFKWDLTAKTFSDQVNNFAKRTKNSLFVSPKVYLGNFLNYTKANWAEGFQEYFQEAAGSAITNYYVKTYKNPAIGGSEFAKASAWSAIKEYAPWTPKGFEVFANGFFMGGVTKRVSNLTLSVLNGSAELYTKTFDKERYKTYVENKAKAKEEALDALNAIIADPERYFSRRKESAVNQYRANQNMSQAELNDDDKTFYDSKDEKIFDHIFTVLDSKTYDLLISALRDMGKLSDVELSQAFNLAEGTKAKEKIEEYIERANEIKQIYNKVNSEFSNPFNPKKFSKIGKDGKMDANYINETLAYKAYEDAKKLAIASQFGFDRAVTRIQGIFSDLSRSAAIMSASATDFNILQNKDLISNEIAILASEISQLSSSKDAKQKELAKKKKKKLDALVKYSNALEKFELDSKSQSNVNEKGQFTIPFNEETTAPLKEAYSEYLRAIANINNEKYIFDDKIENSFKKILDIYNLSRDAQNYLSNVNALANPEILARHATVINKTLRDMYDKRSNILADAFDEIFFINEINNLTKHLAELGVKVTDEQLEELIDNGKLPTQFFDLISNEILVDTDEKVLKAKEAIQTFINFREEKLATLEAEEEVAPVEEKPKEQPKEEKKVEVKPIGEDLQSKLNQAYDDFVKRYPDATLTFDEFVDQHPAALRIQAEYEAEVERKAEPKPAEEKKEAKPEVLSTAPTAAPVSDVESIEKRRQEELNKAFDNNKGALESQIENAVKSKGWDINNVLFHGGPKFDKFKKEFFQTGEYSNVDMRRVAQSMGVRIPEGSFSFSATPMTSLKYALTYGKNNPTLYIVNNTKAINAEELTGNDEKDAQEWIIDGDNISDIVTVPLIPNADKINAKYDAELAALQQPTAPVVSDIEAKKADIERRRQEVEKQQKRVDEYKNSKFKQDERDLRVAEYALNRAKKDLKTAEEYLTDDLAWKKRKIDDKRDEELLSNMKQGKDTEEDKQKRKENRDKINAKYDAELAALGAPVSDIKAKKADIERRRQEEFEKLFIYDQRLNNYKRQDGKNIILVTKNAIGEWTAGTKIPKTDEKGNIIQDAVGQLVEYRYEDKFERFGKGEEAKLKAIKYGLDLVNKEINAKYDAELAALEGAKPTAAPVSDIEAKKADIEKRRQEELDRALSDVNELRQAGTVGKAQVAIVKATQESSLPKAIDNAGMIIGESVSAQASTDMISVAKRLADAIEKIQKPQVDKINAKYDTELAALEGAKPAEAPTEVVEEVVVEETPGTEKAKSILDSVSSLKDLSNPKMTDKNTSTLKLLDLVIEGKISPEDVLVLVEKRRAELLEKLIISDLSKNDYLIFTDGRKGWITSTNPKKNTINVKIVGSAKGVVQTINIEDVKKNLVSVEKKKVVKVEPAEKVTISKVDKETIIESRDTMDEFKDDSAKTKQIADDIAKSDKTDNTDNLNNLLDSLGCDV